MLYRYKLSDKLISQAFFFDIFSEDLRGPNPPVDWVFFWKILSFFTNILSFFWKSTVFFLIILSFFHEISQFFSKFLSFPQNSPVFSQKIDNFSKYCQFLPSFFLLLALNPSGRLSIFGCKPSVFLELSFFGSSVFWKRRKKACHNPTYYRKNN